MFALRPHLLPVLPLTSSVLPGFSPSTHMWPASSSYPFVYHCHQSLHTHTPWQLTNNPAMITWGNTVTVLQRPVSSMFSSGVKSAVSSVKAVDFSFW